MIMMLPGSASRMHSTDRGTGSWLAADRGTGSWLATDRGTGSWLAADRGTGSWLATGRRTVREFRNDILQDRAAALSCYAVLSLFPGLLVLVSLLGLLGKSATQPLVTNLTARCCG